MYQKIAAILMSLFLLLSSSGLAYARHYCGEFEMMAKITLGHEELSCGMAMEEEASGCEGEAQEPDCCDNEYTQIDTDDNFAKASLEVDFKIEFATSLVLVFILNQGNDPAKETDHFRDHSPPPITFDRQVLYDTFLI